MQNTANKAAIDGKFGAPMTETAVTDPILTLIVLIDTLNNGNSEIP